MKTIAATYYPNVRSSASPRIVQATLVRQTKTLAIVQIGEREVRISKTTRREVGVDRFASQYGFSAEQLAAIGQVQP